MPRLLLVVALVATTTTACGDARQTPEPSSDGTGTRALSTTEMRWLLGAGLIVRDTAPRLGALQRVWGTAPRRALILEGDPFARDRLRSNLSWLGHCGGLLDALGPVPSVRIRRVASLMRRACGDFKRGAIKGLRGLNSLTRLDGRASLDEAVRAGVTIQFALEEVTRGVLLDRKAQDLAVRLLREAP